MLYVNTSYKGLKKMVKIVLEFLIPQRLLLLLLPCKNGLTRLYKTLGCWPDEDNMKDAEDEKVL